MFECSDYVHADNLTLAGGSEAPAAAAEAEPVKSRSPSLPRSEEWPLNQEDFTMAHVSLCDLTKIPRFAVTYCSFHSESSCEGADRRRAPFGTADEEELHN